MTSPRRFGVATVEAAVVLPVLMLLLFGMLDLGLAVFRYTLLTDAARHLARQAILHGGEAEPESAIWGPSPFVGTAADNSPIVQGADLILATMPPADVAIKMTWPAGENKRHDPVRVEITYQHESLGASLVGFDSIDLAGISTMRIVQ